MKKPNVVILGGGVGASTFTQALRSLPIELTTIVSAFDDGGSTGALRRDYGGFALGDFRQAILASMPMNGEFLNVLNHRFGSGALYGINVGNVVLKAFLSLYGDEREGVQKLHEVLGLQNRVMPISYSFARLSAKLSDGSMLKHQGHIGEHISFDRGVRIRSIFLDRRAHLNPDARAAMIHADYLLFAPGNFFSSILPHLFVDGFKDVWQKTKAKKVWLLNLLAHKGQDSFYTLQDYLRWFQKSLGEKPFDVLVVNRRINKSVLEKVKARFEPLKITGRDEQLMKKLEMRFLVADLVSPALRPQELNDTVLRAPLRHDVKKIRAFFSRFAHLA